MHFDQISPKAGSQNTHLCLLSHSQHNNIHLQYCSRQPLCVHDRRRGIVLVPPGRFSTGGTYWNSNWGKRRFNVKIRIHRKRGYIRCKYPIFWISSNSRDAQYSIPVWARYLSIYLNKFCMFTVLFERLACRIVLEKPLGQLELLEPNRLISLVVSIRSSYQYPSSFLCMMYRYLQQRFEILNHQHHRGTQ